MIILDSDVEHCTYNDDMYTIHDHAFDANNKNMVDAVGEFSKNNHQCTSRKRFTISSVSLGA